MLDLYILILGLFLSYIVIYLPLLKDLRYLDERNPKYFISHKAIIKELSYSLINEKDYIPVIRYKYKYVEDDYDLNYKISSNDYVLWDEQLFQSYPNFFRFLDKWQSYPYKEYPILINEKYPWISTIVWPTDYLYHKHWTILVLKTALKIIILGAIIWKLLLL